MLNFWKMIHGSAPRKIFMAFYMTLFVLMEDIWNQISTTRLKRSFRRHTMTLILIYSWGDSSPTLTLKRLAKAFHYPDQWPPWSLRRGHAEFSLQALVVGYTPEQKLLLDSRCILGQTLPKVSCCKWERGTLNQGGETESGHRRWR